MSFDSERSYWKPARVVAGLGAFLLTGFVLYVLRPSNAAPWDWGKAMFVFAPATAATLLWWFTLKGHLPVSRVRMKCALIGGFVLGGIGFVGGFYGPMIFSPSNNLGPIRGIFITGPAGFILGTLGGAVYGYFRAPQCGPGGEGKL